jgi:hypothetical protein
MIDQTRISSGFDIEVLLSERYIKYILLTSLDTGTISWWSEDKGDNGAVTRSVINPPVELRENRLYEPNPDFVPHPFQDNIFTIYDYTNRPEAFNVVLLQDNPIENPKHADIRVDVIVTGIHILPSPPGGFFEFLEEQMNMDAKFYLAKVVNSDGSLQDVLFNLELVDLGGDLIELASSLPGFDKEKMLNKMKEQFDRSFSLGIAGQDSPIQRIETSKLFAEDDHPTAIGIYINFRLKNGPEPDAFVPERGDLLLKQNFLPPDHDLAFGFGHDVYRMLGQDIFHRMAEPKPDSPGEYHYPIIQDGQTKGHITSAAVFPETRSRRTPTGEQEVVYTNNLIIDVNGEFFTSLFDPDFRMRIWLKPRISRDGILTFTTDFDLNIPAFGIPLIAAALLSIFTLKLALPLFTMVLAAKVAIEDQIEDQVIPDVQAQLADASLLESFPNNLTIEKRRWDPMYSTHHQTVSLVKDVAINDLGMAFAAYDLRVGKEPKPLDDVVVRSEVRDQDDGSVSGLLYRVREWDGDLDRADLIFPATDRMEFIEVIPGDGNVGGVEDRRVSLTVDQAIDRIKKKRLLGAIPYTPQQVDIRENQIYQLMTISNTEEPEIKRRAKQLLRSELEASHGQEYRDQAHTELLGELGREPTQQEIEERYQAILSDNVKRGLDRRYKRELERYLKFDLEPFEFANLQKKGILILEYSDLQIIKRRKRGKEVYYRDRPDGGERDNLLNLPPYKSETIVRH